MIKMTGYSWYIFCRSSLFPDAWTCEQQQAKFTGSENCGNSLILLTLEKFWTKSVTSNEESKIPDIICQKWWKKKCKYDYCIDNVPMVTTS